MQIGELEVNLRLMVALETAWGNGWLHGDISNSRDEISNEAWGHGKWVIGIRYAIVSPPFTADGYYMVSHF